MGTVSPNVVEKETTPLPTKNGGGGERFFDIKHAHFDTVKNVQANPQRNLVKIHDLNEKGFGGWWRPQDWSVAECSALGENISILSTSIWDANKGGRVQTIIENSPRKDIKLLQGFFAEFDPLKAVLSELKRGWSGWDEMQYPSGTHTEENKTKQPLILLGRFRDNCNIMFLNFPPPTSLIW